MNVKFRYRKLLSFLTVAILLVSFLASLLSLIPPASGASYGWWNTSWLFRKAIRINHTKVGGVLENFPVLINITDSNLANNAQQDGGDIVFVDTSTGVKLNHEIEYFDRNVGYLVAWVSIPLLTNTADKELEMYYGNPNTTNQQNPAAVWDSSHKMVLHLDEEIGVHHDSTTNGNNGTPYGGVAQGIAGKIDGADNFDGLKGYLEVPHSNSIAGFTTGFTASFWLKLNNTTEKQIILNKFNSKGNQRGWSIGFQNHTELGKVLRFSISQDGVNSNTYYASFTPTAGEWYYITIVWKSGNVPKFYVNGAQKPTIRKGTISSIYNNTGAPLYIGKGRSSTNGYLDGTLDEIRISSIARSAAWILTSYNNQKDPSTFYTIGEEETYTGAPSIFDENPQNGASGIYTNPTLSIRAVDVEGDPMTIIFRTNASGTWKEIRRYTNVDNGQYSSISTDMTNLGVKYYWSVSVTDGIRWTNKTYSFTTTTTVLSLKWKVGGLPHAESGVLIADVNGDGLEEIIHAGYRKITALNGADGSKVWEYSSARISQLAKPQMADLNRDGILEIITNIQRGVLALHANNGTLYWERRNVSGGNYTSSPVVADIDGDGYPTIFVASEDITNGLDGQGRLSALSYDGKILYETFTWRPCFGGLSIADTDNDGEFELYMGDRDMYYSDDGYGKGIRSFWAKNLTSRWDHPDILASSHIPILADVNGDGILDVIAGHQRGGIVVLNSTDGSAIKKKLNIPNDAPIHFQPSVYDIDGDGNLEILMADFHDWVTDDIVVWDLVEWKVDGRMYVGDNFYGPRVADVTGDGIMEIIAASFNGIYIFNRTYSLIAQVTGLGGPPSENRRLTYAVVQDIDGDGYIELVISSFNGDIYAFDTPARRPNPRPRSEVQFYSERRLGAAEYVPPPGRLAPMITNPSPENGATNVSITLSELSFSLMDYQKDLMNFTVITTPNIGLGSGVNVSNGKFIVLVSNLDCATTYTWEVSVTDGKYWTNKTYTFTTEALTLPEAPIIKNPYPPNLSTNIPTSLSELSFDINDYQDNLMNFTVITSQTSAAATARTLQAEDL